ncbi:MAG: ABC transporter ATP-binding protein [Mycoplasma sp.]|nr:ABC transporter ATP-binding protein [Mycoplasma sp.]
MKNKPILYVRNLTKYYKTKKIPTIDALNFDVYPGEFHAFIGANGAGKTTTIKSLIGAYYKWSGTILIDGKINESEEAKRQICYIPEKANFPERFSAFSYLKWMIMLSGIKEAEAKKMTEKKLKEMNMWNLRNRSPNTFSSGQKKKILLAQSLICNPKMIIMDEPVANLDPKARLEFFDTLLELVKQGKSIFASSHVLAELDIYADSLTILDGGKIIYSGKKEALLNKYNVNEYLINPGEGYEKAFLKIIKKCKYNCKYSKLKKCYVVEIIAKDDVIKLQKELSDKKIYVKLFKRNYPDLTDIYEDMIIYGSRDTMKEELENKKNKK